MADSQFTSVHPAVGQQADRPAGFGPQQAQQKVFRVDCPLPQPAALLHCTLDTALGAIRLAQENAARLGHSYVGSEHLLLGLAGQEFSPAATLRATPSTSSTPAPASIAAPALAPALWVQKCNVYFWRFSKRHT
mgnify:CR=1 FL=1